MITLNDVQAAARKYAHTRRRNPRDSHGVRLYQYTTADGRHCIAGQILSDLGVIVPGHRDLYNTSSVPTFLHGYQRTSEFDYRARRWLSDAQSLADQGAEWWEAIATANKAARRR